MKAPDSLFLNQIPRFESRNEVHFFLFCCECDIKIEAHPRPINGWRETSWTPDFYLPDFNTYIELKPIPYWHEIERIRPIVYAAIQSGQEFWTWFCTMKGKAPRICEWTNFDPESGLSIIEQMQRFNICDPPQPIGYPPKKDDKQLLLF